MSSLVTRHRSDTNIPKEISAIPEFNIYEILRQDRINQINNQNKISPNYKNHPSLSGIFVKGYDFPYGLYLSNALVYARCGLIDYTSEKFKKIDRYVSYFIVQFFALLDTYGFYKKQSPDYNIYNNPDIVYDIIIHLDFIQKFIYNYFGCRWLKIYNNIFNFSPKCIYKTEIVGILVDDDENCHLDAKTIVLKPNSKNKTGFDFSSVKMYNNNELYLMYLRLAYKKKFYDELVCNLNSKNLFLALRLKTINLHIFFKQLLGSCFGVLLTAFLLFNFSDTIYKYYEIQNYLITEYNNSINEHSFKKLKI